MSDYKVKKQEETAAAQRVGDTVIAPYFVAEAECLSPEGVQWKDGFHNVVVNEGRAHLVNEFFGSRTQQRYVFAIPHSIATNNLTSTHNYTAVSGSNVPGNNTAYKSLAGFGSTGSDVFQTASVQYTFNNNFTIHGALIGFYSTSSLNTTVPGMAAIGNTNTTGVIEYSEGSFAATRTVQNNDTLNITVTVSFGTA